LKKGRKEREKKKGKKANVNEETENVVIRNEHRDHAVTAKDPVCIYMYVCMCGCVSGLFLFFLSFLYLRNYYTELEKSDSDSDRVRE
jgi:hypothetical protein